MPNVIDFLSSPLKKLFNSGDFKAAVKRFAPAPVLDNYLKIQGTWNASTNTPNISGTTVSGHTFRVTTNGSTNLGGITDWKVGDLAVKTDTGWMKIDSTDAMTSFNGRTGAVTLQPNDIGDALGYSPIPSYAQININGVGYTLGANPIVTIETGGSETIDMQVANDSNYIVQNELVALTPEGFVTSIAQNYLYSPTPAVNVAVDLSTSATGVYNMKTLVCPADSSRVVTIWSQSGSVYIKYGRVVNGEVTYNQMSSMAFIASGASYAIDVDWNPFTVNEVLVSYVDNQGTYKGVFVQLTDNTVNSTVLTLDMLYNIGTSFYSVRYSRTVQNRLVAVHTDVVSGYLSASTFTYSSSNGSVYTSNTNTYVLDQVVPLSPNSGQVTIGVLEGENKYAVAYTYVDGFNNTSKSVLFKTNGNSLDIGTPYVIVDATTYPSFTVQSIGLVSANLYLVVSLYNNTLYLTKCQYDDITTWAAEYPNVATSDYNISEAQIFFPSSTRNVFALMYKYNADSLKIAFGSMDVYGNAIVSSGTVLTQSGQFPDYQSISTFHLSGGFLSYAGGKSVFFNTLIYNNSIHSKTTSTTHIIPKFSKETLIGVAATGGNPGSMMPMIPLGGLATVYVLGTMAQQGKTYYVQENGSISTVKSDVKLGVVVDNSGKFKTVSYPIN